MFNYLIVFSISLVAISLELFFTRILNLKAWNHLVYIVIPFVILGYGIGANIYLIFKDRVSKFKEKTVIATAVVVLSTVTVLSTVILIRLPLSIYCVADYFTKVLESITPLLVGYSIVMAPFIIIGFLIVYLFSINRSATNRLYFADLLGAGCGALIFFPLINWLAVYHSIIFLSLSLLLVFLLLAVNRRRWLFAILVLFIGLFFMMVPEPSDYRIDKEKGWEWIPGFCKQGQYKEVFSKWHPLGRTDAYRITDRKTQNDIVHNAPFTFEINVVPLQSFHMQLLIFS